MSQEMEKAGLSEYDSTVCLAWCAAAVDAARSLPEQEGMNLMRACSAGHFRALKMEKNPGPFRG